MALADRDFHSSNAAAPRAVSRAGFAPPPAMVDLLDPNGLLSRAARTWLDQQIHAALGYLKVAGEVRVRVVDDAEMTRAHLKHLNLDSTTDVLTFDLADGRSSPRGDGVSGDPLDVDVLVCADEAARQAKSRGIAPERELLLYVVHAVLHCLGEDDHDDAAFARMHAREDEILCAIGVGATFERAGAEGGGTC